jgi:hypothetical protein
VSCPFFQIRSLQDENYNCIAWAVEDVGKWWWPDSEGQSYWPAGVPRTREVESFEMAYATLGFTKCDGPEEEEGYIKIALFAKGGNPKHAARLVHNDVWTSKLGPQEDIEHSLEALNGSIYGEAVLFMKKRK